MSSAIELIQNPTGTLEEFFIAHRLASPEVRRQLNLLLLLSLNPPADEDLSNHLFVNQLLLFLRG